MVRRPFGTYASPWREMRRKEQDRQLLSIGVFAWMLMGGSALFAGDLALWDWALAGAFALGIAAVAKTSPDPISYCDVSPDRLDRVRVNAGLVVGFLMAVQALVTDGRAAWLETSIWACMIAVLLSSAARRSG